MHRNHHRILVLLAVVGLALIALPAWAQAVIKVNDNVNFKFGILLQTQGDELQDAATRGYAQNVFIRRARFLVAGQIAPNVTFFAETDSPNIGKQTGTGSKNMSTQTIVQDAYVEYKVNDKLAFDAGLMLISPSRNGLQSAASLLPIDYGPHTFANSAPTQSTAGRDTGIMAKGYFFNKKLEYRAGVFQGMRDVPDRELRITTRVQYNFFDPETAYFYTGTYLGKKKVFSVGGGIDHQHDYHAFAIDAFFDRPVGKGAITTQADFIKYDGGKNFMKSLPDQHDALFEIGYLIPATKWMPVVQLARRDVAGTNVNDEKRVAAGLNYFITGHNANVKVLYQRIDLSNFKATNQMTVQLQLFYF